MYYLTSYGKAYVARACHLDIEKIKIPENNPDFERDYTHRFQYNEFMVNLYAWSKKAGVSLELIDHYFDRTTGWKNIEESESFTRIFLPQGMDKTYIDPDGVVVVNTPKGKKLYLFELHRGKDAGRAKEQLLRHNMVIRKWLAKEKYAFDKNNRVVMIFEEKQTLLGTLKKLQNDSRFKKMEDYFIFKSLEDKEQLKPENFNGAWINLDGDSVSFY